MENKICEGKGIIEKKEEATSKKGKYWKFQVNLIELEKAKVEPKSMTLSLWEYEAGHDVSVGDTVSMFWTEKERTGNYGPVTYRNLNSIAKGETIPSIKDMKTVANFKDDRIDAIIKGQCFNGAIKICLTKDLDFKDHFEGVFNSLYALAKKVR